MHNDRRAMTSAAVAISFVGAGVAVSHHLTDYPVLSAQGFRYAAGAGLLYLVMRTGRVREQRLAPGSWGRLLLLALTGMMLFNVAVVRAVSTGEPAVVGTIVGLAPVGVALSVPLLERRRPETVLVAGALLAAMGAVVVEGFGHADLPALVWSGIALGCEIAFTVVAAPLLRVLTPIGLSMRACALAAAALLVSALVVDGRAGFAWPGTSEAVAITYLAVASTAVAFALWYRAMARLGPERTALFCGLMPVSAALVGAVVTTAPLQAGTLLGALLAGAGLVVGLGGGRRRRVHTAGVPATIGRDRPRQPA
jgi:drug/metabolite transporter (DMT)-like permease